MSQKNNLSFNNFSEIFWLSILFVGIILVSLPILTYFVIGDIGIELASVIISSILSLALVVVYLLLVQFEGEQLNIVSNQSEIMKSQTEIMESQSEIMEKQMDVMRLEYRSQIELNHVIAIDENRAKLEIKNIGRGQVHRIWMRADIISQTGDVNIEPAKTILTNVDSGEFHLESNSESQIFGTKVKFELEMGDEMREVSFPPIARKLLSQGITECEVRLSIDVQDEDIAATEQQEDWDISTLHLDLERPENQDVDLTMEETLPVDYSSKTGAVRANSVLYNEYEHAVEH